MTRNPPVSTYDDDFYAWTQEQADALRRLPAGTSGIDIDNLAGEIADLGKRDLPEVESHLKRLVEHLIKIDARPGAPDGMHWFSEALNFQDSALAAFTPSMRQLLDMHRAWERGQTLAAARLSERGIAWVSIPCPFDLDDLLKPDFEINAALARLAAAKSKA